MPTEAVEHKHISEEPCQTSLRSPKSLRRPQGNCTPSTRRSKPEMQPPLRRRSGSCPPRVIWSPRSPLPSSRRTRRPTRRSVLTPRQSRSSWRPCSAPAPARTRPPRPPTPQRSDRSPVDMLDFASLPPEINSALMYSGPGSGPMLTASSAWAALSAELHDMASAYESVIAALTDVSWVGQAAAAMAASSQAQVEWLVGTASQAEHVATQAAAAVSAYEAAFIATVPPPEVAANRALLTALAASNLLGQNTAAILAIEAQYAEMWAQDAAAMYGYAGASLSASTLAPFATAAESADPAGLGAQASAVAQAVGSSSGQSAVTNTLAVLAGEMPTPPWMGNLDNLLTTLGLTGHVWNSNGDGIVVGGVMGDLLEGLTGSQTLDASSGFDAFIRLISPTRLFTTVFKDFDGLAHSMLPAMKAASVTEVIPPSLPTGVPGAAAGGLGKAELVGRLSVPPSWGGVAPSVSPAVTSVGSLGTPVSSQPLTAQPVANSMGLPMIGGSGGRGMQFAAPRYGFKPT